MGVVAGAEVGLLNAGAAAYALCRSALPALPESWSSQVSSRLCLLLELPSSAFNPWDDTRVMRLVQRWQQELL